MVCAQCVFIAEVCSAFNDLLGMVTMENLATTHTKKISISVVSHAQIHLVSLLLQDLTKYCHVLTFEVILTLNLTETLPFSVDDFAFPIKIIRNTKPLGFAANHNQAFTQATGAFFCVMNPDIRLHDNPFPNLLACLRDSSVGVVAPLILNEQGIMESVRRFPTPMVILCKSLERVQNFI